MLSVSMISGYLYCPRKVYLNYVLKIFEPPSPALCLGSIRHKVFEEMNKSEEEIVKNIKEGIELNDLVSVYTTRYSAILKEEITKNKHRLDGFDILPSEAFEKMIGSVNKEAEERASNVIDFMQKNKIYGDVLWEKLTPKIISEFSVCSETLGIRGIVDRIEIYDDIMVPIELKTGKCPEEGAWPSHKLQLCTYMAMLSEKQRQVKQGKLVYLDAGKVVSFTNNPFVLEEVKTMIEKTRQLLAAYRPPGFLNNENKCNACGIKKHCFNDEFINTRAREVLRKK